MLPSNSTFRKWNSGFDSGGMGFLLVPSTKKDERHGGVCGFFPKWGWFP